MECVGIHENCVHVLDKLNKTKPDVVLIDIEMPKVNGIEGLKLILQHTPQVNKFTFY